MNEIKILLIDVDGVIPNMSLMKLSTYWKNKGCKIDFIKLGLSYYPNKKKKEHFIDTSNYCKVYASAIFEGTHNFVKGDNIIWGGTGYDYNVKLDEEIDGQYCDYSLYPNNKETIVFLTRGCIRKCYFCFVPKKEGYLYQYRDIDDIIYEFKRNEKAYGHNKIRFLDNNILSYEHHKDIFKRMIQERIKVSFNEGLDFRLLDKENSLLLKQVKQSDYIFAFDGWEYKKMIMDKKKYLDILNENSYKVRMYIYVHPDMPLNETIERIKFCKENRYLPYIMRDISCWNSEYNHFYIDLASHCNQPAFFKKLTYEQFLGKRHAKQDRIDYSLKCWNDNQ